MARLNEPAAQTETIESLRRKFMRQNRDIARANSTQSLRIRCLENETSRLLAENLGLREEIIKFRNDIENGPSQRLARETAEVKSQLETKLSEIGTLINKLGNVPPRKKNSSPKGKLTRESPSKSPDQRKWKNICTLSEAAAGQDGRLPPILENKSYPRKTLERQELVILSDAAADTTDSPEIGPPPVSQFVDEDPVKIDLPSRLQRKLDTEDDSGLDPALSINLEQRRKRKDSITGSESRKATKPDLTHGSRESTGSLKTGAKRKLSVRDDEESEASSKQIDDSPGDFKFTRGVSEERTRIKAATQLEKTVTKATRELAIARGAPREKPSNNATATTRKVLAPKSVNDSPKKASRTHLLDEIKSAKPESSKASSGRDRSREIRPGPIPIKHSEPPPTINTVELGAEPETPAGGNIFSPSSSKSSTARLESRDTPPPPDLGPGTEGQRPSRRARGAVSYAEPNLRDKMRRPTKDLVDAVGADSKVHRNSLMKLEDDENPPASTIKMEPEADDAWKTMPLAFSATVENSPLSGKVSLPDLLPSSITTHRKRRESLLQQDELEPRSNSGSVIAALLASNRKARAEAKARSLESVSMTTKMGQEVDIYEFRGSSPLPTEEVAMKSKKEEKPASRSSRRHSSIPRDIGLVSDSEASDMESTRKGDGITSRRRQSSLGLRASSAATAATKEDDAEKALKKPTSTTGLADTASRSDRIAARRRSMML